MADRLISCDDHMLPSHLWTARRRLHCSTARRTSRARRERSRRQAVMTTKERMTPMAREMADAPAEIGQAVPR